MVEKEAIKFIHQEEKLLRRGVMNRYTQLLFSMIALVIASPFVLKIEARFPVVSLIFVVILLLAIRAIQVSKPIYLASTLLAVGAFILECIFNFHWLAPYRELVSLISLSLFALFVGLVIVVMIQNLFSQHTVTADSVRGGICLYLLIGVFWAILFEFLSVLDPHAFVLAGGTESRDARYLLFYLSFTTLTTTGFGDVIPGNEMARIFAALESITGVLFLAVFVAQLVNLHILHKTQLKQNS